MNKEITDQVNRLYIMTRKQYLILNPSGEYHTFNTLKQDRAIVLNDGIVNRHLSGKSTLGVFAGSEFTKFICFDVDVIDQKKAKWVVYRLIEHIKLLGIPEDKIHISLSGNKGYHVEIFFTNPIRNKLALEFYQLVMSKSELNKIDYGKVEFRPIGLNNGVKIPLGVNFKNNKGNICWYVDYHGLQPIEDYEYILNIEQMDVNILYDIMECEDNLYIEDKVIEVEEERQQIESEIKPLLSYQQNMNEDETIESIKDLLQNGLTMQGTRNNSLFKLAKYFKYQGLEKEDCKEYLIEWMGQQDKTKYTTSWDNCMKEIEHIYNYIYDNDVNLIIKNDKAKVSYDEMLKILKLKNKGDKLICYCMLMHSKRFATKNGVFYMSYKQMSESSGFVPMSCIRSVSKLAELGYIQIVEHNKKQKGTYKKKPNKYIVNIINENESTNTYTVNMDDKVYSNSFDNCILSLFTKEELGKLLSRRFYTALTSTHNI